MRRRPRAAIIIGGAVIAAAAGGLAGWRLSQHRPGFLLWATPARLTYSVAPDPHPA